MTKKRSDPQIVPPSRRSKQDAVDILRQFDEGVASMEEYMRLLGHAFERATDATFLYGAAARREGKVTRAKEWADAVNKAIDEKRRQIEEDGDLDATRKAYLALAGKPEPEPMKEPPRMVTIEYRGPWLTQDEVDRLPDGTTVEIWWHDAESGAGYTLRRDAKGVLRTVEWGNRLTGVRTPKIGQKEFYQRNYTMVRVVRVKS